LDPLLGMSVIRVVLHNNLIPFGSPASTAFRSASRPTAVALTGCVADAGSGMVVVGDSSIMSRMSRTLPYQY